MIRFILKRKSRCDHSGCEREIHYTVDAICQSLQDALQSGGIGESGYQTDSLVGVEILPEAPHD
jgi:hypothetical protein